MIAAALACRWVGAMAACLGGPTAKAPHSCHCLTACRGLAEVGAAAAVVRRGVANAAARLVACGPDRPPQHVPGRNPDIYPPHDSPDQGERQARGTEAISCGSSGWQRGR